MAASEKAKEDEILNVSADQLHQWTDTVEPPIYWTSKKRTFSHTYIPVDLLTFSVQTY